MSSSLKRDWEEDEKDTKRRKLDKDLDPENGQRHATPDVPTATPEPAVELARKPLKDMASSQLVYFDLETTGLGLDAHLTQLAARCGDKDWSAYVIPKKKIGTEASRLTKLTSENGKLYHNGHPVEAVKICQCLGDFISWLGQFQKPVLVAHNGYEFDSPLLVKALINNGLIDSFKEKVTGFADTLLYFRKEYPRRSSYKLTALVADILEEEHNAHDAIEDIGALSRLIGSNANSKLQPFSWSTNHMILCIEFLW